MGSKEAVFPSGNLIILSIESIVRMSVGSFEHSLKQPSAILSNKKECSCSFWKKDSSVLRSKINLCSQHGKFDERCPEGYGCVIGSERSLLGCEMCVNSSLNYGFEYNGLFVL